MWRNAIIREELKAHGANPLVGGMVELDDDMDDNAEEAEVEVYMSAVYKDLITLAATNLDSNVEDAKGKAK